MNQKETTVEIKGLKDLTGFLSKEFRPRGKTVFTPFNVISVPIILLGLVIITIRFAKGLGAVTNLSQEYPWGLWIGFDVLIGIALAGGAYVMCFMYYILGYEKYHPVVRAVVLNGFLAYSFYAGALILDLGRPWNALNVLIGNKFGFSSVLFMVAWHFFLYTVSLLIEFSPAIAEWLGLKKTWKALNSMALAAVVFGIMLSLGHQGGVGGLFLLAKGKVHPLWYSEFIPLLFVVSSVFAGLSMIIFEGSISSKVFRQRISHEHHAAHDRVVLALAKVCAGAMFVYFFLKLLEINHQDTWAFLRTPMGGWYLLEVLGGVLVPCFLFLSGAQNKSQAMVKIAAILTIVGVVLNRLNICLIAYKWDAAVRYFPSWMEIVVTLTVVFAELWVYRWIVNRMPVMSESPKWAAHPH
ncbi:MAG TPA: Ni/Fe-hydrogenase cytochrome b subunit [Thermodesulfobacteriota bacterium]|nr:Ni/Fe-hydrogenase cytochrome b subunit [Deltaproteobacteria bacterium]HNR11934.1 Ni/Fe-hydrogenase cytochrome b subunit [Thermodesulfobacteriota bacterium]HNU71063.1 Ni/Fe-hydrogenase cytochrome b subunit [Thermodesulfobacteriota bacterium]HQO76917.1 Ni/Fe-hydrogenase cytochrome b subunit [Thermodesulfobacteriota bacterium]